MDSNSNNEKVVLVVDDLFENLLILKRMLEKCGYSPMTASSAGDALEMIKLKMPELILLDVYMPEMDGFELCQILKNDITTKDIPIVFISAGMSKEDKVKGFQMGAVDFINKPFELEEVSLRVSNHIKLYQMSKEMTAYNRRLNKMVQDHVMKIKEEQRNTILSLERMFLFHFPEDEKRAKNIAYNCRFLAQALEFSDKYEGKISPSFIECIEEAVMLHDIGKIANDGHKDEISKGHEDRGARFLEELSFLSEHNQLLNMAIDAARYHNEKWDGTGFPEGKKEEEIPLVARILAVCNGFERACENHRNEDSETKDDYIRSKAVDELLLKSGTFYDPEIVKIFSQIARKFSIIN